MVDLTILGTTRSRQPEPELSDEERVALMLQEDAEDDTRMAEMEAQLMEFHQLVRLSQLSQEDLEDPALQELLGVEKLNLARTFKYLTRSSVYVTRKLYDFVAWVRHTTRTRMVTEKTIHAKFNRLNQVIADIDLTHAFVKDVPTYDVLEKRLLGLTQACDYIKQLGSQSNATCDDTLVEKLALMTKGVVIAEAPSNSSPYKALLWREPPLTHYELLHSPWALPVNTQKLRNLILQVKFESIEAMGDGAAQLAKRCDQIARQAAQETDSASSDTDYDEDDSYSGGGRDYHRMAEVYSCAYMVNKASRQLEKAINREVNYIISRVLSKLMNYKEK